MVGYRALVRRFQRLVMRAVPSNTTVVVLSKGDGDLVSLDGRQGWHFPQRSDGVYAGHYPADSATAIAHLEVLRERGAEFLAIPATSLWWLEKYPQFREHIESRYRLVVKRSETGFIYTLFDVDDREKRQLRETNGAYALQSTPRRDVLALIDERVREEVVSLFDVDFYGAQAACAFGRAEEAALHYLEMGASQGLNPHPLFDTRYYVTKNPEVRAAGVNPLVHFLQTAVDGLQDPSPYFDTEYYYVQGPALRANGVNALVHYIQRAAANTAYVPNPLFGNGYYLGTNPDVRAAGLNPFAHYLACGCHEGRHASHVVQRMIEDLRRSARSPLLRGNWKDGSVLIFSRGGRGDANAPLLGRTAALLASEHHVEGLAVFVRRGDGFEADQANILILEDYATATDVFRPSALRLLAKALTARRPLLALADVPEILPTFAENVVPTYFLASDDDDAAALKEATMHARRLLFASSRAFENAGEKLGAYPTAVALRRPELESDGTGSGSGYVGSLLRLAERDFGLERRVPNPSGALRKIVIPCSDWTVSGVNASLEAVGTQLLQRGWDVEILFTRDEGYVRETVPDDTHLPRLPYRFLDRRGHGTDGMWAALLAYLEQSAPCIVFMAYDFIGNSVVPALSDRVGAVAWAQADDGDYYEQVYRLGRYCNAVVCVSQHIKERVAELNPALAERSVVIHNSSVLEREVKARRRRRRRELRLVYTGRLVQYQKRILDFVDVAEALDERGIPYSITLIGAFSRHESIRDQFHTRAQAHLDGGRIRLLGRLSRAHILEQLDAADFFLLLSDFEGLPLSLVEAMARGCVPVVTKSDSGIPELIASGENGVVVTSRDYGEWAEMLIALSRDRAAYNAMSANAAETVRHGFTVEQIAAQFDEFFSRVAEELRTGSYNRPPALHWGEGRSLTGDVLPPPSLYRPLRLAGLG